MNLVKHYFEPVSRKERVVHSFLGVVAATALKCLRLSRTLGTVIALFLSVRPATVECMVLNIPLFGRYSMGPSFFSVSHNDCVNKLGTTKSTKLLCII